MKEEFLHYIWRYGLYLQESLITSDGLPVVVLHSGQYNTGAGPDFEEAKIKIGDSIWIGHVEIHIKSSSWYSHDHHIDKAYNQVVLHVVMHHNKDVTTKSGVIIPTISLKFNSKYQDTYEKMINTIAPVPCSSSWKRLLIIEVESAISTMGVERMSARFNWLRTKLENARGGWKELYQQVFFRAFGFGKFQENFDILAASIPYQVIDKHKSNLFQLESILFGQAELLPGSSSEPYPKALISEYQYLRRKHNLKADKRIYWKSIRTRPSNNPVVRLAQLAAWIYENGDIFSAIFSKGISSDQLNNEIFVSSYWKSHYDFGQMTKAEMPSLGSGAELLIQINAILPLNAFNQYFNGNDQAKLEWMESLELLPPESNYILRLWKDAGFRVSNAFYSQAFLYLYKEYCSKRLCLQCKIGQLILQAK